MVNPQRSEDDHENKIIKENFQKRLEHLLPPKTDLPAPMSMQQAEELKARVRELETQLGQQTGMADTGTPLLRADAGTDPLPYRQGQHGHAQEAQGLKSNHGILATLVTAVGQFITQPFHGYGLRTKLIASFLLLTIVPLGILGWQTYSTTYNLLEKQIQAEIARGSLSTAAEFQEFLDSQFTTIRSQTRAPELIQYMGLPPAQRDGSEEETLVYSKLRSFGQAKPIYIKSYAILDKNGLDIVDTNTARIGTSFVEQDLLTTALTNRAPYASGLILGPNGDYNMYFVAPFTSRSGEHLGFYVVTYNPTIIQKLVEQMLRDNRLAASTDELTYLVDGYNYFVLGHSLRVDLIFKSFLDSKDPGLVELKENGVISEGKLSRIVFPQPEIVAALSKMEATTQFKAYSYNEEVTESAAVRLSNSDWIVVTSRPTSVISGIIQSQTRSNVSLSLYSIGFVALFALITSSLFTRPILQLTRVAEKISAGNLTQKANVHSRDEIGVLARTFNTMTDQIQALVTGLEQRVEDRTRALELAAEVGHTITEKVANASEMLTTAAELIRARFELYYTQVYLTDTAGQKLILRAGTGEVGEQLLSRGHQLLIDSTSLNGQAVLGKKPVIVADTRQSASFKPNPLLPKTRSEMAIPLIANGRVIGVLDMQSEQPGALTENNLAAFQALAGQFAIAIQNANLFAEAQEARSELEGQMQRFTEQGWQGFLNAIDRGQKLGFTFEKSTVSRLPPEEISKGSRENKINIPITVTGTKIGEVQLPLDSHRTWTPSEIELIQATSTQLAQHIENLRLLAQAEQFRQEAEQAVRRLTREGWEQYKQSFADDAPGYLFDLVDVQPLSKNSNGHGSQSLKQPLFVHEETIGELAVDGIDHENEAGEIIAAVAEQLSGHIENLRLLEQTQQRTLELEEAQTFLDSVIENLPHMLFVKEAHNLRFIRWNKAAEELVGFSEEEMLGKNDYDFFSKEEADFFTAKDREVLDSGKPLDIPEESLATVHQGTRYMHTRKAPIYGADGKPKYLLGVAEDITERKRAEEAVKAEQQRTQTILESVTVPMAITRLSDNHLTFVNAPALEVTQFQYDQVINQPSPNFYANPDDRTKFITELRAKGEVADRVVQLLGANGEVFWALMSAKVFDYQAEPSILTTFMDITDRVHAQETVAKRATELATVAQVSTTASTVLDPDKLLQAVVDLTKERFALYHAHIYLADDAWQTLLLAAGAGEVGRKMVADNWNIPLDHPSSIAAAAARNKKSHIANDVYRDKDSGFLSNRLLPNTRSEMAVPMIVGEKVLGVFDVQSDLADYFTEEDVNIYTTLAVQVAIALQNARLYVEQAATLTQLRELDRLKSSFLANMSHELRTPLNSILGFTDVIMEGLDGPLTENMDADLRLIQKNGQHLLHLINDVLDMAKIEAGRMNLNPESFKTHEVLEEVTSITSTLASEKNLSLFIDEAADRETPIYADRTRLRQVMINLVNNSIKFTEKGKVILNVSPMDGARVLISVTDTGLGIPPEKLEAIFQEFTQVDSSTTRKTGGTGLGLPISRRLVEMHGGRLWADSTGIPGEGSVFFVELPLQARITEVVEKQER